MSNRLNHELLAEYAARKDESAFAELVQRHIDLVYSAALRRTGGDASLAQDIAQKVFLDLSAKAQSLPDSTVLAGWLYRHTGFVANTLLRAEVRRRRREQEYMEMNTPDGQHEAIWRDLAPVLENAMEELTDRERDALLLRFFQQQSLSAVGRALGISEDAARMRVDRAMERLRELLARRGLAATASLLGGVLSTHAVISCPASLAASVTAGALSGSALGFSSAKLIAIMTMTKLKAAGLSALVLAGVAAPVWQYQKINRLEAQNAALAAQLKETDRLRQENQRLAGELNNAIQRSQAEKNELARLRGQVTSLRPLQQDNERLKAQQNALAQKLAEASTASSQENEEEKDPWKEAAIERLNYSKRWGLALILYSMKNGGRMPPNLASALSFMDTNDPAVAASSPAGADAHLEILYQGGIKDIAHPEKTILLREKEPFQTKDGRWARTYLFADGHSEIASSDTPDFSVWESQRIIPPSQP